MPQFGRPATPATEAVRAARDFLFDHATDYDGAVAGFRWPELTEFNFALDWFDVVAGEHPDRPAVTIVDADLNVQSTSYGGAVAALRPGGRLACRARRPPR